MDAGTQRSIGPTDGRPLRGTGSVAMRALVAVLVVLTGLVGACTPTPTSAPTATPTASIAPPASTSASTPTVTPGVTSAPGSVSASSPAAIRIDRTLLRVLPATVAGRPVEEAPAAETSAVADPALASQVERLAVGYVSSASKADWAIASVVALRPGTWSDAFFRAWRDSYEAAACATVGGVGGHAQTLLGGRTVYLGTCGSLVTYHVHLPAPDRIVSVTAAGPARFGEQLAATLRP